MNIKLGDLIIHRTLTEVQDNQFLYVEKIYIVLAIETQKRITVVPSADWICGYQRDLCHDYNNLLADGFSIEVLNCKDVQRSSIFKKLDSSTFETIGYKYVWFIDGEEVFACIPNIRVTFNHKLRGHRITTYEEDFKAAMAVYPNGNDVYIFGDRYSNFIVEPFNVEDSICMLGNEISQKKTKGTKK